MQVAHTSLRVDLTYRIARRLIAARQAHQGANNADRLLQTSLDALSESEASIQENQNRRIMEGHRIFGCGDGSLSMCSWTRGESVHVLTSMTGSKSPRTTKAIRRGREAHV